MTPHRQESPGQRLARFSAELGRHVRLQMMLGAQFIPMPPRTAGTPPRQDRETGGKDEADALQELRREVQDCTRCPFARSRTNLVFGAGSATAALMFIGEAPGYHEDQQGIPFVGRAGQLLTKIINAIGLTREEVYIANILKCRPPQNRNPTPEETINCYPYLMRQIEIIKPKVIVALGGVAAKKLLKTERPTGQLRGQFHDFRAAKLMVTFHPAYLLRTPSAKKDTWEDMKKVRDYLAGGYIHHGEHREHGGTIKMQFKNLMIPEAPRWKAW